MAALIKTGLYHIHEAKAHLLSLLIHSCAWCNFSGASFGGPTACSLPTPAQVTEGTVFPKKPVSPQKRSRMKLQRGLQFGALSQSLNTCRLSFTPGHKQGTLLAWHTGILGSEGPGEELTDAEPLALCSNSEHEVYQDGDGGGGGTATKDISTTCSKLAAKSRFGFLICIAAFTGLHEPAWLHSDFKTYSLLPAVLHKWACTACPFHVSLHAKSIIRTFTNEPFSHGRNLTFFPHHNFFGIMIHSIIHSIPRMPGWAASSQDSLPASYRLCNPHPAPLPAGSQGLGQQLPYIQQALEHGSGPLSISAQQPGDEWQHSAPLHAAWAPSQAQHNHQTTGHLPLPTAAPGLSYPPILCLKPAPFSRPGSRDIAVRAWVMLFEWFIVLIVTWFWVFLVYYSDSCILFYSYKLYGFGATLKKPLSSLCPSVLEAK